MSYERQIILEARIEELENVLESELKWWKEELANCNNYDAGIRAKNRIQALEQVLHT